MATFDSFLFLEGNSTSFGWWGFADPAFIGGSFGSLDGNPTIEFFGGPVEINGIYGSESVGVIYFTLKGHFWETDGWDWMQIGTTQFHLNNANNASGISYSGRLYRNNTASSICPETTWIWDCTSANFPFNKTVNSYNSFGLHSFNERQIDPFDLDMNEIHIDAGGTTGTQVSLNDADVRALNWYGTVHGSTPASGATQHMYEFYQGRFALPTWTYRADTKSTQNASGSATSQHYCARVNTLTYSSVPAQQYGGQASVGDDSYWHVAIRTDSTKTYIEIHNANGTRTGYSIGTSGVVTSNLDSTSGGNPLWHEVVQLNEKFDLVALETTLVDRDEFLYPYTGPGDDGSSASTSYSLNEAVDSYLNVTHLSTNNTTTFTTMSQGTRYGRRVEAGAQASVRVFDQNANYPTAESSADNYAIFRYKFVLKKYPLSDPKVLRTQEIVLSVMVDIGVLAEIY